MSDWISIEDRLPVDGETVIFAIKGLLTGRATFQQFRIGPLPPIPCVLTDMGWMHIDYWMPDKEGRIPELDLDLL